jgi:hypothetical protein
MPVLFLKAKVLFGFFNQIFHGHADGHRLRTRNWHSPEVVRQTFFGGQLLLSLSVLVIKMYLLNKYLKVARKMAFSIFLSSYPLSERTPENP